VRKGARFWGFWCPRVWCVLGGSPSISLHSTSFGGPYLGYGVTMRCSYYPQSLVRIRGANREVGSWIWSSWPAGSVHPELPRHHRFDQCFWPVWPVWALCGISLGWFAGLVCLLVVLVLVSSCLVWRCFAWFCEGFFFLVRWVLGVFLFQGLEKSLRLSETFVVRLL
jgi:hypothetical protein